MASTCCFLVWLWNSVVFHKSILIIKLERFPFLKAARLEGASLRRDTKPVKLATAQHSLFITIFRTTDPSNIMVASRRVSSGLAVALLALVLVVLSSLVYESQACSNSCQRACGAACDGHNCDNCCNWSCNNKGACTCKKRSRTPWFRDQSLQR